MYIHTVLIVVSYLPCGLPFSACLTESRGSYCHTFGFGICIFLQALIILNNSNNILLVSFQRKCLKLALMKVGGAIQYPSVLHRCPLWLKVAYKLSLLRINLLQVQFSSCVTFCKQRWHLGITSLSYVHLSVRPSVRLSVCLSVFLSVSSSHFSRHAFYFVITQVQGMLLKWNFICG